MKASVGTVSIIPKNTLLPSYFLYDTFFENGKIYSSRNSKISLPSLHCPGGDHPMLEEVHGSHPYRIMQMLSKSFVSQLFFILLSKDMQIEETVFVVVVFVQQQRIVSRIAF